MNNLADYLEAEFIKKLPRYKTAFTPLHNSYVAIKKVRFDEDGNPILDCSVWNDEEKIHWDCMFRVNELTNFCL